MSGWIFLAVLAVVALAAARYGADLATAARSLAHAAHRAIAGHRGGLTPPAG